MSDEVKIGVRDDSLQVNPLDGLADEIVTRYRRGERPAVTEYCQRYPELADEIRRVFPTLIVMEQARPVGDTSLRAGNENGSGSVPIEQLGDYRLLREIGRGGMGIVYEAEQQSLKRLVALKILPTQAVLDERQVQRFQREARAAAKLHHTNIVPVFGVGEHDGVYYYVMQFIPGLGLDQVLDELRRLRRLRPQVPGIRKANEAAPAAIRQLDGQNEDTPENGPPSDVANPSAGRIVESLLSGGLPPGSHQLNDARVLASDTSHGASEASLQRGSALERPTHDPPEAAAFRVRSPSDSSGSSISLLARDTTELARPGRQYWHSVARIGVQVADAIDYAAGQGVLHRDIKPSNLLLDCQGTVWVTDFGLAKATDSADLTHTGDVVGTLRYLAPERLRGEISLRGDLYSIGATMYEMLTLQALFQDLDHSQLVRRIIDDEPTGPRVIDAEIPPDLETIVMKAIAKDPADRYRSAADLAQDLRRFLEDKPIAARPIGQVERAWRWCRRNPRVALLASLVVSLLLAVTVISSVAAIWLKRERDTAQEAVQAASAAAKGQSKAEAAQRQELSRAYLSDAQATLLTGRQGQRLRGVEAIRKILAALPANEITPQQKSELRDQAISHLILGDVREVARLPDVSFHRGTVTIDEDLELVAASADAGSGTVIRRMSDPNFRAELSIEGADQSQFPTRRIFSPSGRWLAEYRHNPDTKVFQLVVWDWRSNKIMVHHPVVHGLRMAFHPNDRHLLCECSVRQLSVVDIPTNQVVAESARNFFRGSDSAFSPDGKYLAICTPDLVAEIVDSNTWQTVAALPAEVRATCVIWHPVEPRAVFGTHDGRLYDYRLDQRLGRYLSGEPIGTIDKLSFSWDGRYLASSGADILFQVHRTDLDCILVKGQGQVLRFSRDDRRLAVLIDDNQLVVYDTVDSPAYTRLEQPGIEAAELSPDGNWLAVAGFDGVQFYSVASLSRKVDLGLDPCGPVAFHPAGKSMVTFGAFSHAQSWNLDASTADPSSIRIGPPVSLAHESAVAALLLGIGLAPQHFGRHAAFSRDGRTLVLADARRYQILIADPLAEAAPRVFAPFADVRRVAISPDGKWIAAGAHVGRRHTGVFQATDAKPVLEIPYHGNVAFSQDGEYFASSSLTEVRLYRVGSWQLERTIPIDRPPSGDAAPIAFQPNGRLLAVADSVHRTRLYDRENGQNVANLTHSLAATAHPCWLSFCSDGTRLAVTRLAYDFAVWDLSELQQELAELGLDVPELPQRELSQDGSLRSSAGSITADRGHNLVPPEHWYKFWQRLAKGEAAEGNWPDAIDDINKALRQAPIPIGLDKAELLQMRGTYHLRNGAASAARDDWREALILDPHSAPTMRLLAQLHLLGPAEHRDPLHAIRLIAGLAADPEPNPADVALVGIAQIRLGRLEHGLASLQKVAEAPAVQPLASFFIAMAQWRLGKSDEAKKSYQRAADWVRDNPSHDGQLLGIRNEAADLLELPRSTE